MSRRSEARDADFTMSLEQAGPALLRTLPQQQRTVVVLRYYTDLSEQATAEALGISVGAVKSAGSRGLAALRAALSTAQRAEGVAEPESATQPGGPRRDRTPTEAGRSAR